MKLTTQDRVFFRLVQKAIFTNPFGSKWSKAVSAITQYLDTTSDQERIKQLETTVDHYLQQLHRKGIRHDNLSGQDQTLYKYGIKFLLFHRYAPLLDQHIARQIKQGPEPVLFSDAIQLVKALAQHGLNNTETNHTIALFFQMRRGFYFIDQIVGQSLSIQKLRRDLWRHIFTDDISLYEKHLWNRMQDFSTLILGETGAGKGIAARAIGNSGFIPYDEKRQKFAISFTEGFIPLNLNQISPHLLESELFGHVKGSFTGATNDHFGIFARCSPHGAIFLDEIGETTPQFQVKLLQVLQDRVFTPVGSSKLTRFTGRIIAATNQNINQMRQKKLFRDDFYYRLCSDTIMIPSLAKRFKEEPKEFHLLTKIVLDKILGKEDPQLAEKITSTINKLAPKEYDWPGNVRELEQCVRRTLLKGSCDFETPTAQQHTINFNEHIPANELLKKYCQTLYEQLNTYEAVARITHLDRRTVKRYVTS